MVKVYAHVRPGEPCSTVYVSTKGTEAPDPCPPPSSVAEVLAVGLAEPVVVDGSLVQRGELAVCSGTRSAYGTPTWRSLTVSEMRNLLADLRAQGVP